MGAPRFFADCISVMVNKQALQERLNLCRFSLIAHVILSKGDSPWKLDQLKQKLRTIWKLSNGNLFLWVVVNFIFCCIRKWINKEFGHAMHALSLKPGILRLQAWIPDFNLDAQKSTNAQLWIHFNYLNWMYWHAQILTDLAQESEVYIKIDSLPMLDEFGHYARVLIDIDLANHLPETILKY